MKRDNQLLSYIGVKTNNLKNINFSFKTNNITLIDGVSGSGKSSLAFDTIAAISKNQFSIMTGEGESFQNYILDSFSNTLPCIPLNQLNFNLNPRSTILSYFGLEHSLEYVLSEISHKNMSDFVPSFANECEMCKGLGIVYSFSLDKSIDSNCQISSNPFLFWHGVDNPFYKEILVSFCKEKNIDIHKKFYELSEKERDLLLYGSSTKRIRLVCSINGKKRVRTMSYLGAALFYNNQVGKLLSKKKDFSEISICPKCNGSRFSKRVGEIPLANGVTFSDILLMPFKNISTFFSHFISNKNPRLSESIKNISNFSDFATSIGLEYLNFSRSIPTLSGGELQRLRMIPLLTGKIGNLLIVLDEPSASLYPSETLELARKIKILSRNNTILMIDHNKNMQSISDESIYLGPGSGKNGGCIISKKEYEKSQNMLPKFDFIEGKNTGKICLRSNLVNMEGSIELRTSTIVGICGKNGVGKSTLLSTILNRILPKYELVTQRPIRGNSNSTVGTFSGLVDLIRNVFSKFFSVDPNFFSYFGEGACPKCHGSGRMLIGEFYGEKLYDKCDLCNGSRFSSKIKKYSINGTDYVTTISVPISEIDTKISSYDPKIAENLVLLKNLGLGHLSLSQMVSSLSGGENQRLKLYASLNDNKMECFGLDEPSKGLDDKSIICMFNVLSDYVRKYNKTFYIVDHNELILSLCSYLIELQKNPLGVTMPVFDNETPLVFNCKQSDIAHYLRTNILSAK